MSAAVIGRQLRQQQTTNRAPGPVVPPTHYRGRPININHNYNDQQQIFLANGVDFFNDQGADVNSKFAKFSQQYNHSSYEFYPHPAHRETNNNKKHGHGHMNKSVNNNSNGSSKKTKENQMIFSKHCFCVAFKALSTGVILFSIGTIMSIVGFFADSLALEPIQLNNGTYTTIINKGTKLHLHNMTYVGPVIMGLGFIVIVAACVLTFEVRDTLGIKDDPKNRKKSIQQNHHHHHQQQQPPLPPPPPPLALPPTINQSDKNKSNKDSSIVTIDNTKSSIKNHQNHHHHHSKNMDEKKMSSNSTTTIDTTSSSRNHQSIDHNNNNKNSDNRLSANNNNMMMTNPSDLLSSSYYYHCYCRIPSPVDIELSDPEGCSLNTMTYCSSATTLSTMTPHKWRQRCSCSGSPTNSMLLALNKIVDQIDSTPTFDERKTNFFPIINHQQPSINRNSRMIASIDDLSSLNSYQSESSSSSLPQKLKTSQTITIDLWPDYKHNNNNNENIKHNNNMARKPIYQINYGNNYHHSNNNNNNNNNQTMSHLSINNNYNHQNHKTSSTTKIGNNSSSSSSSFPLLTMPSLKNLHHHHHH
ncbi:uncharacterized protein LOC124499994 isoform X2 [Dermatophagoides farinae]|uniref:uncharacterized protein LOC124499994 isoform X2 n=1 Tax=Dermatophagoides farinae TaxID=6954 RepID=UPI003F601615